MKNFEDKFMEVQVSMISLAMEYVQNQAEKVYIYAIADSLYSFNVFYKIKGNIVHKHLVNDFLPTKSHIDTSLQSLLLKEGVKDVKSMLDVCQEYNREHPTEMWLIYDAQKNSLDSRYSYEGRYDKDEELLPRLEFEKWFEEVKNKQLQEKQRCRNKFNQLYTPQADEQRFSITFLSKIIDDKSIKRVYGRDRKSVERTLQLLKDFLDSDRAEVLLKN